MSMTSETDLTDAARQLAVERMGIDLFGVAPVQRFAEAPEGRRPTDYLPNAKTVVVCAAKITDAAIDVAGRYDEPGTVRAPGGSTSHGCFEAVKMCRSGGRRSGSSSVPTRTKRMASPAPA